MGYEIVRVTSKGQMTIPVNVRRKLGITEDDSLIVTVEGKEIHLRKLEPFVPLSDNDPIWKLVGIGESADRDVAEKHDHYLTDAEIKRWKK